MRTLWSSLLLLSLSGCGTRTCNPDSLLLTITLEGATSQATTLDVTLAIDDGAATTKSIAHEAGHATGTLQLDFASYPAHKSIALTMTARAGDVTLGAATQTLTAAAGCTLIPLTIMGERVGDLSSGGDLPSASANSDGGADMTPISTASLRIVDGQPGASGNYDGIGAAARFAEPSGIASDGNGHLFVADQLNQTIREIDQASGQVTRVAGAAGVSGFTMGPASSARFNHPSGITSDGTGTVYIADTGNHCIESLNASGTVTAVAGSGSSGSSDGTGNAASFNQPQALTWVNGMIYVADTGNDLIRRLDPATGAVVTIAGTANSPGGTDGSGTSATFDQPTAITSDGKGTLYVADSAGYVIRKIVIAGAVVSTIAGSYGVTGSSDGTGASARFGTLGGLAVDGSGDLWISDSGNYTVRKLVLATNAVSTVFGSVGTSGGVDGSGTNAQFAFPAGMAFDKSGSLFLADQYNSVIREIDTVFGQVTTPYATLQHAGRNDGSGASALLSFPQGITSDGEGNAYLTSGCAIRKVVLATGTTSTIAGGACSDTDGQGTSAGFSFPESITYDGNGTFYIGGISAVRKMVLSTLQVTTISTGGTFSYAEGLATDGKGNLYATNSGNHTIYRFDAGGTQTLYAGSSHNPGHSDGNVTAASFDYPQGLAMNDGVNLYVSDFGNCTIRRIDTSTNVVSTFAGTVGHCASGDGSGSSVAFNEPWGLSLDGNGNLFITDSGDSTVRKLVLATGVVTTVAGTPGESGSVVGSAPGVLNSPSNTLPLPQGLYIVDALENLLLELQ